MQPKLCGRNLAAVVAAGIALVVLYGWFTHSLLLTQIRPGFAPMQFNTGLCFLALALAVLLLDTRWQRAGSVLGALVAIFAGLTLLQHLTGANFGIDELFRKADLFVTATPRGRMAAFTAGCLVALGVALLVAGFSHRRVWARAAAGRIACVVTVIAAVVLVGYLVGLEPAYSLGAPSRMAAHTAVSFLLLGGALISWSRQGASRQPRDAPDGTFITASVTIVVMIAVVLSASFADLRRFTESQRHSFEVLSTARSLVGSLFDAQHGMRGYILSQRPEALTTTLEGQKHSQELFQHLTELVRHEPATAGLLPPLQSGLERLQDYLARLLQAHEAGGLAEALQMEATGEGFEIILQLRAALDRFLQAENHALAETTMATEERFHHLGVLLILCSAAAAVLILLAHRRTVMELRRRRLAEEALRADMEERQRTAAALADREAQLAAIFDNSLHGIIMLDAVTEETGRIVDFRYRMVNPAAERLVGLEAGDMLDRTLVELFPSVAEDGLLQQFIDVARTGTTMDREYLTHRTGEARWYRISVAKIGGGLVVNYAEITERKLTESRLQSLAERLGLATRALGAGVWEHDLQAGTLVLDERIHELYGFLPGEPVRYQDWASMVEPEDLPKVEARVQELRATGTPTTAEFRIRRRDGSTRHIRMAAGILPDREGHSTRIVGVNLDITEQRQAQDDLRRSEEKFANAFKYSTCGMAIVSPEGRWLQVNQTLCQSLGYTAEELQARTFQQITHPEDLEADLTQVRRLLAGEIEFYKLEKRYLHRDGHLIWGLLGVTLVRDAAGHPAYFISQIEDITGLKQALFQQEELTRKARTAEQAKSDFLATMSHEIRTPLNGVLGMISLLAETRLDPTQRDYLRTIQTSGDTLLLVINDILDYTHIESGRMQMESRRFSLRGLLAEVLDLVRAQVRLKHLHVTHEITPEVPSHLVGDALHLRQILTNLVGNAVKFTDHGSIHIRMEPQTSADGRFHLRCSVADTGIGIPEEAMPRLFQAFGQLDTSITRRYGGSGLGLAISQRLARMLGGEIRAESVPGKGSTFSFTAVFDPAPVEDPSDPGSSGKADHEPADGSGSEQAPAILLVEDNPMNCTVATLMLAHLGCQPDIASDGLQALEAVDRKAYDAVFMDIHMPGMTGVETMQTMRDRLGAKCPLIIAVTADALQGDEARYLGQGFDGYLAKPLTQKSLRRLLASLRRRRAERN